MAKPAKGFDNIPAPILFTTNCLMPPRPSYADRVFTTEVVSYPEMVHIDETRDFTPVIEKALELGGYADDQPFTGINGGHTVTTGFGHGAIFARCRSGSRCCQIRCDSSFLLGRRL